MPRESTELGVPIGTDRDPTKTQILALNQGGSFNRERGPGSVLIHSRNGPLARRPRRYRVIGPGKAPDPVHPPAGSVGRRGPALCRLSPVLGTSAYDRNGSCPE